MRISAGPYAAKRLPAVICLLAVLSLYGAQLPTLVRPGGPHPPTPRTTALSVLRLVNTGEAQFRSQNGRFGTWEELQTSNIMDNLKAPIGLPGVQFAPAPEILSGLELRLLRSDDGRYSASIQDISARCSLALFTDERGLIYEGRPLGCEPAPATAAR